MNWTGVLPAITTNLNADYSVDHAGLGAHARRLIAGGCTGIVGLGSVGEASTLNGEEKRAVLATLVKAVGSSAPVVAGISGLSTAEAVGLAKDAAAIGCAALMVLPAYAYTGDWRESKAHATAIFRATALPCMLYNNPVSYGTDFLPGQIAELARENANLEAVKESSTDARRVTAIRALCGDRLQILEGVDDCVLEGLAMGAVGWIAGVTNALPEETVALFRAARNGDRETALTLYHWLLPLLRMDTVPKFVQLLKLMQQEAGSGNERVRAPRMTVEGAERERALEVIRTALAHRPQVATVPA